VNKLLHNTVTYIIINPFQKNESFFTVLYFYRQIQLLLKSRLICFELQISNQYHPTSSFDEFAETEQSQTGCRQVIHEENAQRIPERTKGQSSNSVLRVHLSMQRIRVRDEIACEEAVRVAERTTGRGTNADVGNADAKIRRDCGMWNVALRSGGRGTRSRRLYVDSGARSSELFIPRAMRKKKI